MFCFPVLGDLARLDRLSLYHTSVNAVVKKREDIY